MKYLAALLDLRRENLMLRIEIQNLKMKNPAHDQARLKEVEYLRVVVTKLSGIK